MGKSHSARLALSIQLSTRSALPLNRIATIVRATTALTTTQGLVPRRVSTLVSYVTKSRRESELAERGHGEFPKNGAIL